MTKANQFPADLFEILHCPDCSNPMKQPVTNSQKALSCTGCNRDYPISEDGILQLLPSKPPELPPAYDDPDYKCMSAHFDSAYSYFTEGNSLFEMIHKSSHKTISRWRSAEAKAHWTCDLGCGQGYHYRYIASTDRYIGVDIRLESLRRIRADFPDALLIQANSCALPFRSGSLGTILSVYAFEHIYHLSQTVSETVRVLEHGGRLFLGLPCEGGLAWTLGRKLTSERTMSKRYNLDYKKYIKLEHCNTAGEVLTVLEKSLTLDRRTFFPLPFVPFIDTNLTVTASFRKE